MPDRNPTKKKIQPWGGKKRNRKHFISTNCNKMNNNKRNNWDFYEIKVENKRRNFHHRLKKHNNKFTAERFSEPRPLIHSSKHLFRSQQLRKYLSYEADFFFSKCSKFNLDSKNAIKMRQKFFGHSDNCIWIGDGKFSLLLREYS